MTLGQSALVEVGYGRLKPIGKCTRRERRRAERHEARKLLLIQRWTELVADLGTDWCPQTPLVLRVGAGERPSNTTLPEWEQEIAALEAVLWMRDNTTGVN
jgi:hypothetical protein